MFKKKKTCEVQEPENFKIPQIISPYKGIRKSSGGFIKSKYVSPTFGTGQKDIPTFTDASSEMGDIKVKYDNFRSESDKQISKEETIAKYGTAYPEFRQITKEDAEKIYGEKIEINKIEEVVEEKKEELENLSFIEDASNIKTNSKEVESVENQGFDFNVKNETRESEFKTFTNEEKENFSNGNYFLNDSNKSTNIVRKSESQNGPTIFDDPKFDHKVEKNPLLYPDYESKLNEVNNSRVNNTPVEPKIEEIKSEPQVSKVERVIEEKEEVEEEINVSYQEMPSLDLDTETESGKLEMPIIINKYRDYKLPPLSLLSHGETEEDSNPEWLDEKKAVINDTLIGFNVDGEVVNAVCGPTFTRYEIKLAPGVNVNRILGIESNLQMNLGVTSIRIQAPIPGKTTIGVEVPNDKRRTVMFGDIISEDAINDGKPLNVPVGKDIDGNIISTNIAKWPHGLIAGGTGSGKSVCINTIIASLILKNKPNELKFIMIDPKFVELAIYNDLPHMAMPVIQDPKHAAAALKWAVDEMNRRYLQFTQVKARDIISYNQKTEDDPTLQKMCYIVIIIDELADLMLQVGAEVEDAIQSITQKARAAGIHLLVATQRPDKDTVKGTIKANITARLAFRVQGQVNSQIILDETGAETLLGNGDMLLKDSDIARRVQGAYIPDSEIDSIVNFITDEAQPDYQLTLLDLQDSNENTQFSGMSNSDENPDLIYQIAKYCIESQACSVNRITQDFSLGFNRAQKIVDTLENMGIVSERKGTKRDILINLNQLNDMFERSE